MENLKFRIVNLSENINPKFSLTFIKNNSFNVFDEEHDKDLGSFDISRLINNFSLKDLDELKKSKETTNFCEVIIK